MNKITKKIVLAGVAVIAVLNLAFALQAKQSKTVSMQENASVNQITAPMQRDSQIILRLANNHRPDYPTSVACDYFAGLVEERTEGRIRILTYHSAVLGDEKSTVSQVMYGGIDMARVSIALLTDYEPELIALQMPYLYRNSDHMWEVLDSEIGDGFLEGMEEIGVEGLCWYDAGARNFYMVSQEVNSVKDLKGLRIRVQESSFMADLIRSLGAEPVEIPFDKVGSALRRGEIDGAENNFSSYISTGHYTCAKKIVLDEHIRIPEVIIMNRSVMGSLSEEDQEIIRQAARDSQIKQRELWDSKEEENLNQLKANGTEIAEPRNKEEFVERVQPVYDEYGEEYYEVIQKIRDKGV